MKNGIIIASIIIVFTLLNSLQFWVGIHNTPTNLVYLGTIHNPGDYFYYLSQFKQGEERIFSGYDLLTGEFKDITFVGWVNILLGRLFSLIGINAIFAYQISVLFFTSTVLFFSWMLLRKFFQNSFHIIMPSMNNSRMSHLFSNTNIVTFIFLLFCISNALPVFPTKENSQWLYSTFWFNSGVPFIRLGGVPHHLLTSTVILATILLFHSIIVKKNSDTSRDIQIFNKPIRLHKFFQSSIFEILLFILFALILSSLNPVQWLLLILIVGLSWILHIIVTSGVFYSYRVHEPFTMVHSIKTYIRSKAFLLPFEGFFLFFLFGIPVIYYYSKLFSAEPYINLKQWEATHQLYITLQDVFGGFGLIPSVGILLLPLLLIRPTFLKFVTLLFPVISLLLFFSKIPFMFDLHNVRFLPPITILFLCISASHGILIIMNKLSIFLKGKQSILYILFSIFYLLLIFPSIPSWITQIKEYGEKPLPYDNSFYIHKDMVSFFSEMKNVAGTDKTFLVAWPYNLTFSALSGRRVFHAHDLLTINYPEKDLFAYNLFENKIPPEEATIQLKTYGIDYIIASNWMRHIDNIPGVHLIKDESGLLLYSFN
jgi:hypothetical protein